MQVDLTPVLPQPPSVTGTFSGVETLDDQDHIDILSGLWCVDNLQHATCAVRIQTKLCEVTY